mmetsp:Transcript_58054/g.127235  ORF Transcript_58054/g.127235 Transcript_58054/m.127235 type:complete len:109 (+) Transcript_58054:511-837(+)
MFLLGVLRPVDDTVPPPPPGPRLKHPSSGQARTGRARGGFGTVAYAVNATTAARLVRTYDFSQPVDLWMQAHGQGACEVSAHHDRFLPLLPFRHGGGGESEIEHSKHF